MNSVFKYIEEFFTNLFHSLNFSDIFLVVFGIIIGVILFIVIYLLIWILTKRKKYDIIKLDKHIIDKKIDEIVLNYEAEMLYTNDKIKSTIIAFKTVVKEVAILYYPNNKYALYMLNTVELLNLVKSAKDEVKVFTDIKVIGKALRKTKIKNMIKRPIDEDKLLGLFERMKKKTVDLALSKVFKRTIHRLIKTLGYATSSAYSHEMLKIEAEMESKYE